MIGQFLGVLHVMYIYILEVERVALLQNRAGSGYFKNSRTGPGRAGYTRSVEKLDNNQCSKQ